MIVRIRGVNRVRSKGHVYLYHRKTGTRLDPRLPPHELLKRIAELDRKGAPENETALPGTLGHIIVAYKRSPEYTELRQRTKDDYQKVFDWLKPIQDRPLDEWTSAFVYKLRDKAFKAKKRRFANYVIQVLSRLFNWAKARDHIDRNPAADVDKLKKPRNAPVVNRAWKDEEIEAVLQRAPAGLLVPFAIGLFTGLREGDMVRLPKTAYNGTKFETRAEKNGQPIRIPAHKMLREILNESLAWRARELARVNAIRAARGKPPLPDATNLVVGARLKPFTQNGFQSRFFKFIRKLAEEGLVGEGLSYHGLRHTAGKLLAEAGCSVDDIMVVLGVTREMAEHYSKEAERVKRASAAILKLEERAIFRRDVNG